MYAEAGISYPYFQSFPQEAVPFDDFSCSQKLNSSSGNVAVAALDNNLWGGDLFQAPIDDPIINIDPMTAAISMISCGDDIISTQSLAVSDIESSIESGQILSEVFYECRKDLLAKECNNGTPLSEIPASDSGSCCLNSTITTTTMTDSAQEAQLKPDFLDFPILDFSTVYGMRRAFSEGDIQTLGHCSNVSFVQSQIEQQQQPAPRFITSSSSFPSEDRREKLSRYRSKKSKRNFDRKIKYACRKALADSQPRIRGRFAKTEETMAATTTAESWKKQ
ncbi:uncharacterized protein LOC127256107 [Andrographis paniculata]|uniref:uncharacterized protein LOC127256107 n=1 Tax=Andrographis paniculata TaxID=175694 RepID=UPI0021E6FD3A|nr:uncharacterized protein LOC127256107 [Andrographis paniculata]